MCDLPVPLSACPFWYLFPPIIRSDVDRYISKTYHEALHYVKPDVIIFLGDLIDEGSVAGEQEFKDYVRRFYNIFNIKKNHDKGVHAKSIKIKM